MESTQESVSASTICGCIHKKISKEIFSQATSTENVKVFEKTLIGGFSWVNTRLVFDSNKIKME